jgi:flagellar hook-associated protein 2
MAISSLTSALSQPSLSFDGVASGLQTTDIISKLMSLEQGQLTALQKQQTTIQTRDRAYQAVKSKVSSFQSAVQTLMLSNSVIGKTATSVTPAVATATASSSALNGSFSVNVQKLATATSVTSGVALGRSADLTSTTQLANANLAIAPTAGTFTLNGQAITIATSDTWADVQNKISTATSGAVSLNLGTNGVSLTSSSPMQLGAASDTSNFLSALHLQGSPQTGTGPYTVASNQPLGSALAGGPLSSANLAVGGGIASGGDIKINGVAIHWDNTDSLNAVLSRINASNAGVAASYDPSADKVSFTNLQTGASSISLEDTTGNFLQAIGVLGASQTVGAAAEYTITQNGVTSATQYSNTNTVSNALPGVNLTLASQGTTSINVAQDTSTTTNNIQAFVTQFNALVDEIANDTKYDPNTKTAGPLQGDASILGIADQVRTMVSSGAVQPAGATYNTLRDIGISTGSFGAAVGTTNHLTLDTGKLTTALQTNPQAVYNLLAGLTGTTTVSNDASHPWVASTTGSPLGQVSSGSYAITYDPNGNTLSSVFTPVNGAPKPAVSGTISAGGINGSLIPGLSITARGVLPSASGTDTVAYNVKTVGVMQTLNSYLNSVLGTNGLFATESSDAQSELRDISDQINNQNDILTQKQANLQAQFTAMEVALSQLQSQSSSLASSLSGLSNSSGS